MSAQDVIAHFGLGMTVGYRGLWAIVDHAFSLELSFSFSRQGAESRDGVA